MSDTKNEVWVVAAAAVSALGKSLSETGERLWNGECGLGPVSHFAVAPYPCRQAGLAADLLNPHQPSHSGGRLPKLLAELCRQLPGALPADTRLVGSCLKGAIDLREQLWRNPAGTTGKEDAGRARPFCPATRLADHLCLAEPGLVIHGACASSALALALAAEMIATGRKESILVWGAEIISEFVFSGFSALKILSPTTCRPFDRHRDGLVLGEAAAGLWLLAAGRARRQGLRPLAVISGWGTTNDACHLTTPDRSGRGLAAAGQQALSRAGLAPSAIAAVKAHGTGTRPNDAMELMALGRIFGNRGLPPIFSLKGALGHTLGAAGVLETALAISALKRQQLPPTVGLQDPEPPAGDAITLQVRGFSGDHLLLTNSGFGGFNTALIISRPATLRRPGNRPTQTRSSPAAASRPLAARLAGWGWVDAAGWGRGGANRTPGWPAGTPTVPREILENVNGGTRFGRLDLLSRIGVAACALALEDAGIGPDLRELGAGMISATTSGCEVTDRAFFETASDNPGLASPGLFVYTLDTAFIGEAALRFGLTGLCLSLEEPRPGGLEALRLALCRLATATGEEIMLVGCCNLFDEEAGRDSGYASGALFMVLERLSRPTRCRAPVILSYHPETRSCCRDGRPLSGLLDFFA